MAPIPDRTQHAEAMADLFERRPELRVIACVGVLAQASLEDAA